jgi:hypothetical protein
MADRRSVPTQRADQAHRDYCGSSPRYNRERSRRGEIHVRARQRLASDDIRLLRPALLCACRAPLPERIRAIGPCEVCEIDSDEVDQSRGWPSPMSIFLRCPAKHVRAKRHRPSGHPRSPDPQDPFPRTDARLGRVSASPAALQGSATGGRRALGVEANHWRRYVGTVESILRTT